MRSARLLLFVLSLFLLAGCAGEPMGDSIVETTEVDVDALTPSPRWSPEQVARIVLVSLQHNDEPTPNAGIETAFRFASPANQWRHESLDHFAAMVRTPSYAPLLNSQAIAFSPLLRTEQTAELVIRIINHDGVRSYYYMKLSRQEDGRFEGCWMTDAVMPVDPERIHEREHPEDDDETDRYFPPRNPVEFVMRTH